MALTNSKKQADDGGAAKAGGQGGANAGAVGQAVAQARRAAGMTQRDLADKLDVRLWMVDEWEAGATAIAPDQLARVAAAMGTTPEQLLGEKTESAPPAEQPLRSSQAVPAAPVAAPAAPAPAAAPAPQAGKPAQPAAAAPEPTADQIRKAELPRSLRGYDPDATRKLLGGVASVYERVLKERDEARKRIGELEATLASEEEREDDAGRQPEAFEAAAPQEDHDELAAERDELQRRVAELEAKLAGRDESEQMLTRALLAAGRAGEELVKQAQTEADSIVTGARGEADSLVAAAREEAEKIGQELEDRRAAIDKERDAVRRQLRREALASTRSDLEALHREAEPVLDGLLTLSDRLRALIWPDGVDGTADAELLEDLRPTEQAETEPVGDDAD